MSCKCSYGGSHTEPQAIPHTRQAPGYSAGRCSGCPPPQTVGHRLTQVQAHSGLLSGSEHIHKDTHVRGELSILPTATATGSPAGWPVLHTGRQILSPSSYVHSVLFRKLHASAECTGQCVHMRHAAEAPHTHTAVKVMDATERLLFT